MAVRVTPLGAGQVVGRSCILLEIAERRVLLDCGVKVGCNDEGHIPDFDLLDVPEREGVSTIDAVVISHFHLDHIGALPYLTEVLGYEGPVLMTAPTKAIGPMMLDDYLKFSDPRSGRRSLYERDDIDACFARATCMQLEERFVLGDLAVTPFYAGHVIGAVMLLIEHRGRSVFYTGDFTMVPDHLLSAAHSPLMLRPDVMLTESTYCTTIRSSKRAKEQELCRKIQQTLERGGKVLVPVGAVGGAQELVQLCEKHWQRMGLNFPIYLARGMAERTMALLRLFISWSSEAMRKDGNAFAFPHVHMYDSPTMVDSSVPMVLFAGPQMLNGGPSLEVFKKWAPVAQNLVIIPGYCLPGTIGNEVLAGSKSIDVGDGRKVAVRCQVEYMSHSDHTDARGITQLIAQIAPRHVILVHGSADQMRVFQPIVQQRLRVPCITPAIGETVEVCSGPSHEVLASPLVLREALPLPPPPVPVDSGESIQQALAFSGLLRKRGRESWELHDLSPAGAATVGLQAHTIRYKHVVPDINLASILEAWETLEAYLLRVGIAYSWVPQLPQVDVVHPQGTTYTLSFMQCRCRLEFTKKGIIKLTLEWTRADELRSAEVAHFLEVLELS